MASRLCNASPWVLCDLGSCVELNRSSFLEPEGLSKARKSVFITRKLTVSVGEIVNGGPLPPVPRHTPVCSFNSQNKYTSGTAWLRSCPRALRDPAWTWRVSEAVLSGGHQLRSPLGGLILGPGDISSVLPERLPGATVLCSHG